MFRDEKENQIELYLARVALAIATGKSEPFKVITPIPGVVDYSAAVDECALQIKLDHVREGEKYDSLPALYEWLKKAVGK